MAEAVVVAVHKLRKRTAAATAPAAGRHRYCCHERLRLQVRHRTASGTMTSGSTSAGYVVLALFALPRHRQHAAPASTAATAAACCIPHERSRVRIRVTLTKCSPCTPNVGVELRDGIRRTSERDTCTRQPRSTASRGRLWKIRFHAGWEDGGRRVTSGARLACVVVLEATHCESRWTTDEWDNNRTTA